MKEREHWGSRIGLVLAMAGNAVGLGNFLRFPGQAAAHGGGAFLIPYFICLIVMAVPLMWLEWTMGRFGGARGHGTTPGMFQLLWKHPIAKYLGVVGIFIPTILLFYYAYIGSWTLGYSLQSLLGKMPAVSRETVQPGMAPEQIKEFVLAPFEEYRRAYVGELQSPNPTFLRPPLFTLAVFFFVWALSVWLLSRGVVKGIEALAKFAMPLLFVLAILLIARIVTLGNLSPYSPIEGFAFLWEPRWFIERDGRTIFVLLDAKTWLAAAGQVFFTLSLGFGAIQCYASYLREKEDVVLTGLSTTAANEFAEIVLGASIAIPAAVAFFGVPAAQAIAAEGSFFLGFTSMPAIFGFLPFGRILGFIWFFLLFLAALTSIVAIAQPLMAFLEDEFGLPRERAAWVLGILWLIGVQFVIWVRYGWQVMDFWAGTFGPPLMALLEVLILMWLFGAQKTWEEMHRGAQLQVPRIFLFFAKYLTPAFLIGILGAWTYEYILVTIRQGRLAQTALEGVPRTPGVLAVEILLLVVLVAELFAIGYVWKKRKEATA